MADIWRQVLTRVFDSNSNSLYVNSAINLPTYSAVSNGVQIAGTPTDVFTISGAANKMIKIREVTVTGVNSSNLNFLVTLVRRSSLNTGGTSSLLTAVPYHSDSSAASAIVRQYTGNPTVGTEVGYVRTQYLFLPALASANAVDKCQWNFGDDNTQCLMLRSASELVAVNLLGATIGGTTVLNCRIEWTEEPL